MTDARRTFGNEGEQAAAAFLEKQGMCVLARQARTPFGEIDLVCEDGGTIACVEVKTRRTQTYGYPEESVTREKLRHMARSAEAYMTSRGWEERPWRLDVIAIEFDQGPEPRITHFPDIDMTGVSW